MKIEIDLNKCSLKELKLVTSIMEKNQEKDEIMSSSVKTVEVAQPKKLGRPNGSKNKVKRKKKIKRRAWKMTELIELIKLNKAGKTDRSIARKLGRTTAAIGVMLNRLEKKDELTKMQRRFVKRYMSD